MGGRNGRDVRKAKERRVGEEGGGKGREGKRKIYLVLVDSAAESGIMLID